MKITYLAAAIFTILSAGANAAPIDSEFFASNCTSSNCVTASAGNAGVASGPQSTAGAIAVASGYGATAGDGSVALGAGSVAGVSTIDPATGQYIIQPGDANYSTAVGTVSSATGYGSAAYGNNAVASGDLSVSLGSAGTTSGTGSTNIGAGGLVAGEYGTNLGFGGQVTGYSSVAIGAFSVAARDEEVNIGGRLLGGLVDGVLSNDAATVGQVATSARRTLQSAGQYTDDVAARTLATANIYADQGDAQTLIKAYRHTDETAVQTLQSANTYTDEASLQTLRSANSYTDGSAAQAISASNNYTDIRSTETLNTANKYTDDAIAALGGRTDQKFAVLSGALNNRIDRMGAAAGVQIAIPSLSVGQRYLGLGVANYHGQNAIGGAFAINHRGTLLKANMSSAGDGTLIGVSAGRIF